MICNLIYVIDLMIVFLVEFLNGEERERERERAHGVELRRGNFLIMTWRGIEYANIKTCQNIEEYTETKND